MESTNLPEKYEHDLYKYCENEADADAIAWAFVNKDKMVKFPYKHPTLESHEVRGKIITSGLCLSDQLHARGLWGQCPYPIAPGHEVFCEITDVGSDVTNVKVGEVVGFAPLRACCEQCKYCISSGEQVCQDVWDEKFLYGIHFGGYSTHIQQPGSFAIPVPKDLPLDKCAPLLCAGATVYAPLKRHLKEGDRVAVIGIGGLGHLAVQYAHKMGYEVTAVTSSSDKVDLVKELGATSHINSNNPEELKQNYDKFDVIINTTPASAMINEYIKLCAPRARFIQVGLPAESEMLNIQISPIVLKEINYVGSIVGSREETAETLRFSAEHKVYPIVEEFSFEDFPKAFDRLENGKPHFRCVVNVKAFSEKNNLFK